MNVFKNISDFFHSWVFASKAFRMMLKLKREQKDIEKQLAKRQKILLGLEDKLQIQAEKLEKDTERVSKLIKRYEEDLDSVRSQLNVAEKSTIPALVSANKLLLERWDAEIANQVKLRMASTIVEGEG